MGYLFRGALAPALIVVLLAAGTAPAAADSTTDGLVETLGTLSAELDDTTRTTKRITHPEWDPAAARAVRIAGIDRLERTLALARVRASEALDPLIGTPSAGAVAAAITAALWTDAPDDEWRRTRSEVLDAWRDYRRSVRRASSLRNRLRTDLGLPLAEGLRVCPLESEMAFDEDWGDPRGWRTHKGNDINAPEGTRLVAMERGVVIQLGYHYLGGNGIYVLGDLTDDVYYYAHLSAYAEGMEIGTPVEAGQVIGYVGSTGNSDLPHLHLGWMPGAGRVDLDGLTDAYELLRGLCR